MNVIVNMKRLALFFVCLFCLGWILTIVLNVEEYWCLMNNIEEWLRRIVLLGGEYWCIFDAINPKPLWLFTHILSCASWVIEVQKKMRISQYSSTASWSDQIFLYLSYFCTSIKVHPACPCPFCLTVILHAAILIKNHGARLNTPPTLNHTHNPEARWWDSNGWSYIGVTDRQADRQVLY